MGQGHRPEATGIGVTTLWLDACVDHGCEVDKARQRFPSAQHCL